MKRRLFVATAAAGAVGASAGCLSDVIDDITTVEAAPIRVAEAAADDAGYEYRGTTERIEEREFAGETVEVTNYISEYTRTIDLAFGLFGSETEAGVFAAISTPQVSVAGKEFNPVGEMSTAELAEYIQNQYDQLDLEGNVGSRDVTAEELDLTVSLDTWEGTATLHGEAGVDVFLDIAQPNHGDDHLVIAGVYPDDGNLPPESERDRLDAMVGGLRHGDDVEVELREDSGGDSNESGDGQ